MRQKCTKLCEIYLTRPTWYLTPPCVATKGEPESLRK